MTNDSLQNQICRAVDTLPRPDVEALWQQPVEKLSSHDAITCQTPARPTAVYAPRSRGFVWARALAACACLALVLFGGRWYFLRSVEMQVMLDVNPSFSLEINRVGRVIDADALNDDAEDLIDEDDLEGLPVEQAIDRLFEALEHSSYLAQSRENLLLLSVRGQNTQKAEALSEKLSGEMIAAAQQNLLPTTVLRQSYTDTEQGKHKNLSDGKARLVRALDQSTDYSQKQLLSFSLPQLAALAYEQGMVDGRQLAAEQTNFSAAPEGNPSSDTNGTQGGKNAAGSEKLSNTGTSGSRKDSGNGGGTLGTGQAESIRPAPAADKPSSTPLLRPLQAPLPTPRAYTDDDWDDDNDDEDDDKPAPRINTPAHDDDDDDDDKPASHPSSAPAHEDDDEYDDKPAPSPSPSHEDDEDDDDD